MKATAAVAVLTVGLFAGDGTAAAQGLEGRWFGESQRRDTAVQHIAERSAEGALRVHVRVVRTCRVVRERVEWGRWESDGRTYSTLMDREEGLPPRPQPTLEVHVILRLDAHRFLYRRADGWAQDTLRVDAAFEFPPPIGCPDEPSPARRRQV